MCRNARKLTANLQLLGEGIAELLWPTRCVICDIPGTLLCDKCRQNIPFIDPLLACPYCGQAYGRNECTDCNSLIVRERGLETAEKLSSRGNRWEHNELMTANRPAQPDDEHRDAPDLLLENKIESLPRIFAPESSSEHCAYSAHEISHETPLDSAHKTLPEASHENSVSARTLDQVVSVFAFAGVYRRLITTYKDNKEIRFGKVFARLLAPYVVPSWIIIGKTALVAIPARRDAIRERGFDHMKEVGTHLSKLTNLPLVEMLQPSEAADQRHLDAAHRRRNMRDSFVGKRPLHDYENVILVDDVLTTGATLLAGAHVLKEMGVCRVFGLTLARLP